MEKQEQINNFDQNKLNKIADELDDLQKSKNEGRGVGCIQAVVAYLKAGKLNEAKKTCWWDHDKIITYPEIVEYVKNNLFENDKKHPWSLLEKLQKTAIARDETKRR